MTEPALSPRLAYTRQAVEEYLQGVEAQRRELEAAIADARARRQRATDLEKRILSLEQRIGAEFVTAHVRAHAPLDPAPSRFVGSGSDDPRLREASAAPPIEAWDGDRG
jgi:hypothetical protein